MPELIIVEQLDPGKKNKKKVNEVKKMEIDSAEKLKQGRSATPKKNGKKDEDDDVKKTEVDSDDKKLLLNKKRGLPFIAMNIQRILIKYNQKTENAEVKLKYDKNRTTLTSLWSCAQQDIPL